MRSNLPDTFNPFEKSIAELESDDLLLLRKVHEGWYVDYKEGPINQRGYAKAISAMANTYGGWVFIGIKELSRDDNVAGEYPGVPSSKVDLISQGIRQAVAEHLNPTPYFELRSVAVPLASDTNNKVICIHVPSSPRAPIIHSDGRIYRRVNDSSEPVAENNRDAVEHLFTRSQELAQSYGDWFDRDPELSESEDQVSYLRLISIPDYWGEQQIWYGGNTEDFRNLLQTKSKKLHFSQPYDNIYYAHGGFVCRATQAQDRRQIAPTMIVYRDFKSECWLPLPAFEVSQYEQYYAKETALDGLVEYLSANGHHNSTALDLSRVFGALDAYFRLQKVLQLHAGYKGVTHVKFKLKNAWRRIPLIAASIPDLGWDHYGVPMILWEKIGSPKGGVIDLFEEIELHQHDEEDGEEFALGLDIFYRLLLACGLGVGNNDDFLKMAKNAVMASYHRANKLDSE